MTAVHNPYKPRVGRGLDGWLVLLDGRWRRCTSWQNAIATALAHCDEHGPGCGRKGCPCTRPGPVCEEYMGIPGDWSRWCPRCGWSRSRHEDPS